MTHEFTLVIEGADPLNPANLNAWFEAGAGDATFGQVDGVGYADFSRASDSAPDAILSAISDLERAVHGARVIRVEPDEFVTASEIATRLDRTRESVRLLIAGERGPGGFPAPISHLKARGRIWRWAEVARWAQEWLDDDVEIDTHSAIFVAALNDALDLRRLRSDPKTRDQVTPVALLLR
jgi:hypothetical protein